MSLFCLARASKYTKYGCVRSDIAAFGGADEAGAEFSRFVKRLCAVWFGVISAFGALMSFLTRMMCWRLRAMIGPGEFYFGKIRHPPHPPRLLVIFSLPWVA